MVQAASEGLGERLRKLREARGMTQATLAEKAGVSFRAVSGYELGTFRPGLDTLCLLATALGVSLDKLLARKKSSRKSPG